MTTWRVKGEQISAHRLFNEMLQVGGVHVKKNQVNLFLVEAIYGSLSPDAISDVEELIGEIHKQEN